MVSYVGKQNKSKGASEFGTFAFACALGCVSRKSKCAKCAVAVYYVVVSMESISLISFTLAITARWYGELPSVSAADIVFAKSRQMDASYVSR